jgi:hypothetical protein
MAKTTAKSTNLDGGGAVLRNEVRRAQTAPTGDDRPFAILRYAKLKNGSSIAGSANHMRRSIDTPNADPARTGQNLVLIGSEDPRADVMRLLPKKGERDEAGRLKRRENSVLAVEVLLTTSPSWWATASEEDRAEWVRRSHEWLVAEWGAENVAHLELHVDETTPHITGLVVPLDEKGHLNARAWIGGRASRREPGSSALSGHQTRYAAAVEPLGLRRGRIGSTATHTTLREFHRRIDAAQEAAPTIQLAKPPVLGLGRDAWAKRATEVVAEHTAGLAARAGEHAAERQRRLAAEQLADRRQEALEAERAKRKALTDQMRALPLPTVLDALGLEPHPKEAHQWIAGPKGARTHRITVKGGKWYDHVGKTGRGGAIDLVQHVLERDFAGSLAWLADRFGTAATEAEFRATSATQTVSRAVERREPFQPPKADPVAWPEVRRHLIEDRALPADLIDAEHEAGNLYATSRPGQNGLPPLRNAVFVQRDAAGRPTGAELKGIIRDREGKRWSGLAPGSRRSAGSFAVGDLAAAARVFVVEAAVDALSLAALLRSRAGSAWAVISSGGDGGVAPGLLSVLRPAARRYAAQDANHAGDRQAASMGEDWQRFPPPEPHEDWNDALVALSRRESGSGPAPDEPPALPSGPEL